MSTIDDSACWIEMASLVSWCTKNKLELNTQNSVEMVIFVRTHHPLDINN